MKFLASVLASLVTALLLVGLVSAENQGFVRMFPRLPAFELSDVALANLGACTPAPCTRQSTGPMVDPDSTTFPVKQTTDAPKRDNPVRH